MLNLRSSIIVSKERNAECFDQKGYLTKLGRTRKS